MPVALQSGYHICLATAADIPAITAMYRADGLHHAQGDPARASYYYATVRSLGGKVLVAIDGDQVIGHLELLLCQEAPPLGRYGYLEALEVRTDRRRRGVGRTLVDAAKALTRAAGGTRLETVPEDAAALAFYQAAAFRPGTPYVDLDLATAPDGLCGVAPLGLPLPPGARPWRTLRHVAGRQYAAPYCWARAYLADCWDLPEAEGTGAWQLQDSEAVVLADPWLVHLFLPSSLAPESDDAWPAWQAMLALRAGSREGYVRTVVTADLAERLRLLDRWPGSTADPFTLLTCPLGSLSAPHITSSG
ncbi:MAG: GNAT family N-acetyltransferase [Chloroflexota bacterium]